MSEEPQSIEDIQAFVRERARARPAPWWDHAANRAIIGLEPLDRGEPDPFGMVWPYAGYDDWLRQGVWDDDDSSGRPRADWIALADEMIARWTTWRARVLAAPDAAFTEGEP